MTQNSTLHHLPHSVRPSILFSFLFFLQFISFNPVSPFFHGSNNNEKSPFPLGNKDTIRYKGRREKEKEKQRGGGLTIALARLHGCFFEENKENGVSLSVFVCVILCDAPYVCVCVCERKHSADIS